MPEILLGMALCAFALFGGTAVIAAVYVLWARWWDRCLGYRGDRAA